MSSLSLSEVSTKVPVTIISAPAATALDAAWGVRIPPPTIKITSVALFTALIIASGTGSKEPDPASR